MRLYFGCMPNLSLDVLGMMFNTSIFHAINERGMQVAVEPAALLSEIGPLVGFQAGCKRHEPKDILRRAHIGGHASPKLIRHLEGF